MPEVRTGLVALSMIFGLCALSCAAQGAASKALPSIHDLLTRADEENLRDGDALGHLQYVEVSLYRDTHKSDPEEKEHERGSIAYCVAGVRVKRMVCLDGYPLRMLAEQGEEERIAKLIKDSLKAKRKASSWKAYDDWPSMSTLEQTGSFSNEQRIVLDGRPAISLAYAGNSATKPKVVEEKILAHLRGALTFDEEDGTLRSGALEAPEDIGLGLAMKARKGFHVESEMHRLTSGMWVQTRSVGEVEEKVLFTSAGFQTEEWRDAYVEKPCYDKDPFIGVTYWRLPLELRTPLKASIVRSRAERKLPK